MRLSHITARSARARARAARWNAAALSLVVSLAAACQGPAEAPLPVGTGRVEGDVSLAFADSVEYPGWVVVHLSGPSPPSLREAPPAELHRGIVGLSPKILVVERGRLIILTNSDHRVHRFFSVTKGNERELPFAEPGQSQELRLESPGLVRLECSEHPGETGWVLVVAGPLHTTLERPGRYAIEGVPAGRYAIAAVGEDGNSPAVEVEVRAGETTRLELPLGGEAP